MTMRCVSRLSALGQLEKQMEILTVWPSFSQVVQKAADIQDAIAEGANSFLFTEYKYLGVFMVSRSRS